MPPQVVPAALVLVLGLDHDCVRRVRRQDVESDARPPSTHRVDAHRRQHLRTQTARVMKSGLLRASDLPRTWKDSGEPSVSGSSDAQIAMAKTISACRDFADTVARENEQTKVSSNNFVDAAAAPAVQGQVSNEVVDWPSIADAKTAYRVYSGEFDEELPGRVVPQARLAAGRRQRSRRHRLGRRSPGADRRRCCGRLPGGRDT